MLSDSGRMNGWIKFSVPHQTQDLLMTVRTRLDELLKRKIKCIVLVLSDPRRGCDDIYNLMRVSRHHLGVSWAVPNSEQSNACVDVSMRR